MSTNLHAVMRRHGPPALLTFAEDALPAPGPDEVRIRVETAGVSPADLLICWGLHPEARRPPFTPGWDVIGVVDAAGSDVRAPRVGARVAALTIVNGFSRFVCIPAEYAVAVPDGLDPAQAQCLPVDYIVAYQMLRRIARVNAGGAVLVQGAAGSIGSALVQLGRADGLTVYGTASGHKLSTVEGLGGIPIDYTREDFVRALSARLPGGADAVFDGVGYTLWRSFRCLKPGGVLVWYGNASSVMGGQRDWSRFAGWLAQCTAISVASAISSRYARSYHIQALRKRHPDWYRTDLTALFELLRDGRITPRVFGVLPLESAREALQQVSDGRVEGKLILRVSGAAAAWP